MRVSDIPEISQLSIAEKILLVEDLWESIAADDENALVPQSHREELDRRYQRYESNPGNLLSIDELQARIRNRK